jgi:cytochrome b561
VAPEPSSAGRPAHAALAGARCPFTHLALYGLFFAVPLSGWAYSSAAGFPVVVFGVLPLPDFVPVDRALAETLKGLHKLCTLSLAALVLLHVAAALKHQFVDRDGLLQRMRPGRP